MNQRITKMQSVKILAIDDEQIICDGCRLVLSDHGHSVDAHMTGKEGLDAIRKGDETCPTRPFDKLRTWPRKAPPCLAT